jgi:tRNA-modifying protein YgfZ
MTLDADQLERVRREGGIFRVTQGIRLRFSGADAFRYLNGQITRDLKRLGDHEALSACILTPKGKLCALLSVHREGDDLIVEADAEVSEALRERLERYLVADDVVITEESCLERVHFFGDALEKAKKFSDGISLSRLGVAGCDLPAESSDPTVELLDPSLVEILRIERGIPAWGREIGPETLPPEAGLDRTAIDYDRGCYPGQEVISRLKSIGRVNRLLHGFRGDGLRQGMKILSEAGSELGTLTSAAGLPGTTDCVALGYLPRSAEETRKPLFASDPLTGVSTRLSITATFGT